MEMCTKYDKQAKCKGRIGYGCLAKSGETITVVLDIRNNPRCAYYEDVAKETLVIQVSMLVAALDKKISHYQGQIKKYNAEGNCEAASRSRCITGAFKRFKAEVLTWREPVNIIGTLPGEGK